MEALVAAVRSSPWTRRVVAAVVLLFALMKRYRVLEAWADMKRRAALLRRLPGPKLGAPSEHPVLGHLCGEAFYPPGCGLTPSIDLMPQVTVPVLQRLAYEQPSRVVRFTALNSAYTLSAEATVVLVADHALAKEVLSHKAMADFHKGKSYDISDQLIGDSVLHVSGPLWAAQRPAVEKGMGRPIMERALPRVLITTRELLDRMQPMAAKGEPVDFAEWMLKLTLDVIGRAAFSHDFGSVRAPTTKDAPLYDPFQVILRGLDRRVRLIHEHYTRWLPTPRNRTFDAAMARLDEQVDKVLLSRLREMQQPHPHDYGDLLQLLLENHLAKTKDSLPFKIVRDDVKTMLFAGHDTTGAALAWFFRLMAENPDKMKRCREEVQAAFGPHGDPTYDGLEDLEYVNACVMETLRLYPSAGFTRSSDHDVALGGGKIVIPAKAEVLLVPFVMHRDPQYWSRAGEFVPERFMEGGSDYFSEFKKGSNVANSAAAAEVVGGADAEFTNKTTGNLSLQAKIGILVTKRPYMPFSAGPRNCVGRPLALLEMRVVICKLLQHYSFELPRDSDPDFLPTPLFNLTLNPQSIRLVPVALS